MNAAELFWLREGWAWQIGSLNTFQYGPEASLHNFRALPNITKKDQMTSPSPLHPLINDKTAWPS